MSRKGVQLRPKVLEYASLPDLLHVVPVLDEAMVEVVDLYILLCLSLATEVEVQPILPPASVCEDDFCSCPRCDEGRNDELHVPRSPSCTLSHCRSRRPGCATLVLGCVDKDILGHRGPQLADTHAIRDIF